VRIIHTSDWHLGRRFGPVSLAADQEAFTAWFVDLCRDQQPDLVVIAGDLFDRAIAPVEAIELFRDTVRRLLGLGATVAAVTGNHDGPDRVAPYGELLDLSGLYLRGGYRGAGSVLRLEFPDGPLDLVLLPFLDPQAAPDDFGTDPADTGSEAEGEAGPDAGPVGDDELLERRRRRTHASVLADACRAAVAARHSPRAVAVAHAFVRGGLTTESERQLVVGGTGEVPAELFTPFSYTALGHLHRPQAVAGVNARYSGSPLPYSFSEEHDKSVVVIEMDTAGATTTTDVTVEVGRRVRTLTGRIDELLDPARHPDAHDCFVRAVLTDRETVLDAKARLAELYPHVVEVQLRPLGRHPEEAAAPSDVRDLSPLEAARAFWEAAEGAPPDPGVDALLVAAAGAVLHGGAR
jgi:exonuclease SbcD